MRVAVVGALLTSLKGLEKMVELEIRGNIETIEITLKLD